ncbi:MAG: hypothetical protein IKU29_10140, partial [Parabacteroides sp.]|nr:hypothetical protein [Parabacteroides sp.]
MDKNYIPSNANITTIVDALNEYTTLVNDIVGIIYNAKNLINLSKATIETAQTNTTLIEERLLGENGVVSNVVSIVEGLNRVINDNKLVTFIGPVQRQIISGIFDNLMLVMDKVREVADDPQWYEFWRYSPNTEEVEKTRMQFENIKIILEIIDKLKLSLSTELKVLFLGHILEEMVDIVNDMWWVSWKSKLTNKSEIRKVFDLVKDIMGVIAEIGQNVKLLTVYGALLKIRVLKSIVSCVMDFFTIKQILLLTSGIMGRLWGVMLNIFRKIGEVMTEIDKMSLIQYVVLRLKISIYASSLKILAKMMTHIIRIGLYGLKSILLIPGFIALRVIFENLKQIFWYIYTIKVIFLFTKLTMLPAAIGRLEETIKSLRKVHVKIGDIVKAYMLKTLFNLIKMIVVSATVAALASVVFVIVAPALMIGMIMIASVIRIVSIIVRRILSAKTLIGVAFMTLIITMFSGVAIALIVLSVLANYALRGLMGVFIFLTSLIPIMLAMIAIGFLLGVMVLSSTFALLGISSVVMMVGGLIVIALSLKAFEFIKLDKEKIQATIDDITSILKGIIQRLFGDTEDMEDSYEGSTGFLGIIAALFGSSAMLIQSLASSIFFVTSMISVVAMLALSGALILLGKVNLNTKRIQSAIRQIFGLTKRLNEVIFDDTYDIETGKTKKAPSWISKVFTGVGEIIKSILVSAYVVTSILSIVSMLVLAGMLWLFGKMKIDKAKIESNINTLFGIIGSISSVLFADHQEPNKSPKDNRGGFITRIFNSLASFVTILLTIPYVASSLLYIGVIYTLGQMLNGIGKIQIDNAKISENVGMIFGSIDSIKKTLNSNRSLKESNSEESKKSFLASLGNKILSSIVQIWDVVCNMGYFLDAIVVIGMIYFLSEQLKSISKLKTFNNIGDKASLVLGAVDEIMLSLSSKEYKGLSGDLEDICDDSKYIKNIIGYYKRVHSDMVYISQKQFDVDGALATSNCIKNIIRSLFCDDKFEINRSMVNKSEKFGDIMKNTLLYIKFMDNHLRGVDHHGVITDLTNFIDKIGSVKLENLQTARNLFKEMKEFSQSISGDFEGLAEALN